MNLIYRPLLVYIYLNKVYIRDIEILLKRYIILI